MNTIGLRVTPNEIFYAIVTEGEELEVISISRLKLPKALDLPSKLRFVRNTLVTLINQYNISRAGIKMMEGSALSKINKNSITRFNIEGVILEVFSNSVIENHLLGLSSNIASILGIEHTSTKEMLDNVMDTKDLQTDQGTKVLDEYKEAIIVALAASQMEV